MLSMLTSWVKDCTSHRTVSCQRSKRAFLPVLSLRSLGQTGRTRKSTAYHITNAWGPDIFDETTLGSWITFLPRAKVVRVEHASHYVLEDVPELAAPAMANATL
jgi:hypothetical protein